MDWYEAQSRSDEFLAEGIFRLSQMEIMHPNSVTQSAPCNYIVSERGTILYIGEASSASARIKVQWNPKRSTFYKNYLTFANVGEVDISQFDLRLMNTYFGRKEVEDFGIVNLPAPLNRFQLDKRKRLSPASDSPQWDRLQGIASAIVEEGARCCLDGEFRRWSDGIVGPTPGLYLIRSKAGEIIYVGESSDISARFKTHGTRTYFSAVRRNLGEDVLNFKLQTKNGKKRYFEEHEDHAVTDFLNGCWVSFFPANIGRYEVEEFLIHKIRPILNRKSKGD